MKKALFVLLFTITVLSCFAQSDSLVFVNAEGGRELFRTHARDTVAVPIQKLAGIDFAIHYLPASPQVRRVDFITRAEGKVVGQVEKVAPFSVLGDSSGVTYTGWPFVICDGCHADISIEIFRGTVKTNKKIHLFFYTSDPIRPLLGLDDIVAEYVKKLIIALIEFESKK
jgi:hypothetical protein